MHFPAEPPGRSPQALREKGRGLLTPILTPIFIVCYCFFCFLVTKSKLKCPLIQSRKPCVSRGLSVERVMGIEPTLSAWEADVLPLNYTRIFDFLPRRKGKNRCTHRSECSDLVPMTGIEPVRDCSHGILSPGRLPVPPHRRIAFCAAVLCYIIIARTHGGVKGKIGPGGSSPGSNNS